MQIQVYNPQLQTILFGILFLTSLVFSIRKIKGEGIFSFDKTQELKGFAILAIIFSHIGYFLSADTNFLYPFSIISGVGVNLFLFLSGFGLTISAIKTPLSIMDFYKKRLTKLFFPLWIIITCLFVIDILFFKRNYSFLYIFQSYLGFFPQGNPFRDLNSPLWYFTIILFYYLVYPIFFWRKLKYISPLLIFLASYLLLMTPIPINWDVLNLYRLHNLAFPIGVLCALLMLDKRFSIFKEIVKKIFFQNFFKYFFNLISLALIGYFSINSWVGTNINSEQFISLTTMFLIVFVFLSVNWQFKVLSIFGKYSYEIYLIHWPILFQLGILYWILPAFLATYLYLLIFLFLAYFIQKLYY